VPAIPPSRAVEVLVADVLVAATLVAALHRDAAVALLINPGAAALRVALLLAGRHRRAGVAASAFLTVVTARTARALWSHLGPPARMARP
jgi:hypothetical protein